MHPILPLLLAIPAMAHAQPPARTADLIAILNGGGRMADSFTPAFLAAVPEVRLRRLAAELRAQAGRARSVARADTRGTVTQLELSYDRATVAMTMTVDPAPPGRISGLVIAGPVDDATTVAAVLAKLRALPGTVAVAATGLDPPTTIAAIDADRVMAIGSTFKLLVLAELVRTIHAGEHRWDEVVTLDAPSVPSGILQDWPAGSPLTLHTLATLMIAQSDNSATDRLLRLLGSDKVAAVAATLGWAPHPGNDPLLSTLDLARIKGGPDRSLATRYAAADPLRRREMLRSEVAAIAQHDVDLGRLSGTPTAIDTVEWQASPADLIHALDWFRRTADPVADAILAVNPGLPAPARRPYAYVGYKGGSEAGVMSMSYLLRTHDGRWLAVTGSWNDPARPLEETRFATLIARLVELVGR